MTSAPFIVLLSLLEMGAFDRLDLSAWGAVMNMDVTPFLYLFDLIAGIAAGLVCGLPAFVMALYRQNKGEALLVLLACAVSGMFFAFYTAVPVGASAALYVRRNDKSCDMLKK